MVETSGGNKIVNNTYFSQYIKMTRKEEMEPEFKKWARGLWMTPNKDNIVIHVKADYFLF